MLATNKCESNMLTYIINLLKKTGIKGPWHVWSWGWSAVIRSCLRCVRRGQHIKLIATARGRQRAQW
jgi:hypothetical protein